MIKKKKQRVNKNISLCRKERVETSGVEKFWGWNVLWSNCPGSFQSRVMSLGIRPLIERKYIYGSITIFVMDSYSQWASFSNSWSGVVFKHQWEQHIHTIWCELPTFLNKFILKFNLSPSNGILVLIKLCTTLFFFYDLLISGHYTSSIVLKIIIK